MTASEVKALVETQIGDDWDETNHHGVNLREALVAPQRCKFIHRFVRDGSVSDTIVDAWLVLEEEPSTRDGYKIIYDEQAKSFGLASPGFERDPHPCVVGLYGDFWAAFKGM